MLDLIEQSIPPSPYRQCGKLALKTALVAVFVTILFSGTTGLDAQNRNKNNQRSKLNRVATTADLNAAGSELNFERSSSPIERSAADTEKETSRARLSSQVYPIPALETVITHKNKDGSYQLSKSPKLGHSFLNRRAAKNQNGDYVFFTVDEKLQAYAEKLVKDNHAPHVALVAIDPTTGKILALAEKSVSIPDLHLHAGFPAASLFKVVTAAAAIDSGKLSASAKIPFRGGTYELSQWNYLPNAKKDKRSMSLGEALGKSCNPVFGRIATNSLNATILEKYGKSFGFSSKIPCDLDVPVSNMEIPSASFGLSRTAAGFGDVNLSPLHAATLMAGLANKGLANKPLLIDRIISPSGEIKFKSQPQNWTRLVPQQTADRLMELMVNTTTVGTSRKEFYVKQKPVLGTVRVAGKTGTLSGKNPVGLNNWFIGSPIDNPKIAVAAVVVDPGGISSKASRMGRLMIQKGLEVL